MYVCLYAAAAAAVTICKKNTKRVYCLGTIRNVITIRMAIQTNLFLFSLHFGHSQARSYARLHSLYLFRSLYV